MSEPVTLPTPSPREQHAIGWLAVGVLVVLGLLVFATRPYSVRGASLILTVAEVAESIRLAMKYKPRLSDGTPDWPVGWGDEGLAPHPRARRLQNPPPLKLVGTNRTPDKDLATYEVFIKGVTRTIRVSMPRLRQGVRTSSSA